MNIAVDIGNTRIKCGIFYPDGEYEVNACEVSSKNGQPDTELAHRLLRWETVASLDVLTAEIYPSPLTWRIAQTGSFSWEKLKTEILKERPQDEFQIVDWKQIPLKIDVDFPEKTGIDRLLAAFAAVKNGGNVPMLVVDAGSAITVDVVQNQTFCGGAIFPGLSVLSATYPTISKKLPLVPIPGFPDTYNNDVEPPIYPGKNTEDAILTGLYWGTIGAIRQFYDMVFPKKDARVILTGGDAEFLWAGLSQVIPLQQVTHCDTLVLDGINLCFDAHQAF